MNDEIIVEKIANSVIFVFVSTHDKSNTCPLLHCMCLLSSNLYYDSYWGSIALEASRKKKKEIAQAHSSASFKTAIEITLGYVIH